MYVYVYVCVCVYIYIYIYILLQVARTPSGQLPAHQARIKMSLIGVCMYVFMHVYICIYVYMCLYLHACKNQHAIVCLCTTYQNQAPYTYVRLSVLSPCKNLHPAKAGILRTFSYISLLSFCGSQWQGDSAHRN